MPHNVVAFGRPGVPPASTTIIACMPAASGDGASTTALNIAHALAMDTQKPVALVDLDLQYGMCARQLDIHATDGVEGLLADPRRSGDETFVSSYLRPYGAHLHVLPAPGALHALPDIKPEAVHALLATLSQRFAYVVLDLPHAWTPWVAATLSMAHQSVLVAQLSIKSLVHVSRSFMAWEEAGLTREDALLVVNRSGANHRDSLSPKDFERVSMKRIDHYLPDDIRAAGDAEQQGKTVVELGPCSLEKHLRALAHRFAEDIPLSAPEYAGGTVLQGVFKRFSGKTA